MGTRLSMSTDTWRICYEINKTLPTPRAGSPKPLYLVGLSGGVDSSVLARAAGFLAERKDAKFTIGAVIVNHNLQDNAEEVTQNAATFARSIGLSPVIVKSVQVETGNGGMEADARQARYEAFEQAMEEAGAQGVLLAHNLNDQAEQVFLGLSRGAGLRSISGMRVQRDQYHRPLLSIPRSIIENAAQVWNISAWRDPHNTSDDYARVRVRNRILPVVEEQLGAHVTKNLVRSAAIAQEESDALDYVVDQMRADATIISGEPYSGRIHLNTSGLKGMPLGLQKRFIHRVLSQHNHEDSVVITEKHVNSVVALVNDWHGQGSINLPGEMIAKSNGRYVTIQRPGE